MISKAEVARRAGVSRETLYVWLATPEWVKPSTSAAIVAALIKAGVTAEQLRVAREPTRLKNARPRKSMRSVRKTGPRHSGPRAHGARPTNASERSGAQQTRPRALA